MAYEEYVTFPDGYNFPKEYWDYVELSWDKSERLKIHIHKNVYDRIFSSLFEAIYDL